MHETVEQYIGRITGYVGDRDPRAIMAASPARLRALIGSATPAQLTWTSSPSRWTITQIVAHLADAEVVGAWRFRSVLARNNVPLQSYDQNEWASAFRYEQVPVAESLAVYEALRTATLRLLELVEPARLEHAGMHAERGRETVFRLMQMYGGHDLNHLGQIERLLEESRAAG
jgi:hypothetical protein